ncbi:hypothetical protein HLG78_00925 [Candidatus Absconditicoccus praedator]|nr:hypothetical protein HLG78_00925 [Candidatus Absconditicoccus praedator]
MDNIKKYIIIGLVGIFLTIGFGFFLMNLHGDDYSESALIEHIPGQLGQVFYMSVDDRIESLLELTDGQEAEEMIGVLDGINELAVFQEGDGVDAISFILVDVDRGFDIQQVEEIGFLMEEGYDFQQIEGGVYVYGNQESISFFEDYDGKNLEELERTKNYVSTLGKENNFGVLSAADADRMQQPTEQQLFQNYIDILEYSLVVGNISSQGGEGQISALFSKDLGVSDNISFQPEILENKKEGALAHIEIGSLFEFLGIDADEVAANVGLTGGMGMVGQPEMFSDEQIADIIRGLDNNISISLGQTSAGFGVGGEIIIDGIEFFDAVEGAMGDDIEQLVQQLGIGQDVDYYETENGFGVDVTITQGMPMPISGSIEFEGKDGKTHINIFDPTINGDLLDMKYTENSLLTYYINLEDIVGLLRGFAVTQMFGIDDSQLDMLEDKKVYGSFDIHSDEAIFNFKMD